ncbi:MAG: dihydroorotate dehydrogenase [Treponema sp.]|jgi:dihydroorotate dehydrogenase (NAD+) catalytic subunit|nr:dihydroorotate dehydrogenase [Treponema sp.]
MLEHEQIPLKNTATVPDLSVCIGGIRFKNPVIAASGTFGYGREYQGLLDIPCLGGICTKGLTLHPRQGNTGPRLHETPGGILNSIGLENPGIPAFIEQELPLLRELGPVVIANLAGSTVDEYREGARLLARSSVDMIELNISCPNVKAGGMAFGLDPKPAASVVQAVREVWDKPLMVKLSPNAPDLHAVAGACVTAGADAFSLVNTFQAMAIDIYRRKPVFQHIKAGLSGPGIRPLALRMVWDLGEAVRVPLVGVGGIANAADALEFLLAGAVAVQVGSATFSHPPLMPEIIQGIAAYMQQYRIARIADLSIRNKTF